MSLAVLSDIHSNHLALEACLRLAGEKGVSRFVFLGDYVTDCAYPHKTAALLEEYGRRYDCRFIRGNREGYLLDYRKNGRVGWRNGSASGGLLYTYENLSDRVLKWFSSLDFRGNKGFVGLPPFSYCHGSPCKAAGRLEPEDEESQKLLGGVPEKILLCGHTHKRRVFVESGKRVINPGSVGLPQGTPGKAQFALLHEENDGWREEFLEAPYDKEAAVQELEAEGLFAREPVWAAMTRRVLLTGDSIFREVVDRVRELWTEETESGEWWSEAPERYWEQAASEYHLT